MITLSDLEGRLTCTVEEAAEALGIGRSAAYAAVRRDQIPHLTFGRRVLVKAPALLELCGVPNDTETRSSPDLATADSPDDITAGALNHDNAPTPSVSSNVRHLPGR